MALAVCTGRCFGSTKEVARGVSDGLSQEMEVDLHEVREAPGAISDLIDLMVVGGPTHAGLLSRATSRADAVRQGAPADGVASVGRDRAGQLAAG